MLITALLTHALSMMGAHAAAQNKCQAVGALLVRHPFCLKSAHGRPSPMRPKNTLFPFRMCGLQQVSQECHAPTPSHVPCIYMVRNVRLLYTYDPDQKKTYR